MPAVAAAFGALTAAAVCLWLPRELVPRLRLPAWIVPASLALIFALVAGLVDSLGLLTVLAMAGACQAANSAANRWVRLVAHAIVLGSCAGFFLHAVPGFANPRVLSGIVLSHDSVPYTKYLNFDKGMAGLLLLGLYVPDRVERDKGARYVAGFGWRFLVVLAVVQGLAVLTGYVRWDPKLPSWWPMWTWSMFVLTALPEEALFRGVLQSAIATRRADETGRFAILAAGLLFGLTHLAGGPLYVLVASAAGVGYGWIYASTRSIGLAIVAHAGLNAVHLVLFTYPALSPAA